MLSKFKINIVLLKIAIKYETNAYAILKNSQIMVHGGGCFVTVRTNFKDGQKYQHRYKRKVE